MDLYLMRHGACLSAELEPNRPLSPVGLDFVRTTARAMRLMGLDFDIILASTKTAAMQTAGLAAKLLGLPESRIHQVEQLSAKSLPERTLEALRPYSHLESVLLVGSLPNLERLAGLAATQDGRLSLNMENACLAKLELEALEPGQGRLMWSLAPIHLHLMAGSPR